MKELLIKRDDSLTIIRKENVECIWKNRNLRDRTYDYYVTTTGGNTYKVTKVEYTMIRFLFTDDR